MSVSLRQPIGQKRLTNVAIVRLKKHGLRFEIACYKNKVLSWRSGVEKDLDEVLQSQTVYMNVSKGVLAKATDLIKAFGTDDQSKICLEILDKGELQVAGKERESQLSSQFRDIATMVMNMTINPETKCPYTNSMIERLLHEIHFAVDPNKSSKKQALEVIRKLQEHFPIKRAPLTLRFMVPEKNLSFLMEKLSCWDASILSKDESGDHVSVICELETSRYRECDELVRNLQGRLELHSVSGQMRDAQLDEYEDEGFRPISTNESSRTKESDLMVQLGEKMQKHSISTESRSEELVKQTRCTTCDAIVGDARQYREHFKSEWHKHNLKRKMRQLPPITAEECAADIEMGGMKADLNEYSF
ncbi:ribosome maturation protein SBDS [Iris pallida]|uniref:Ribosome maturation protein SBDS n=1 Tax=Iris pallida TaxID=29817 RepID=A0AAX6FQW4_IRIPA|nr:ribosome maturation protein SBDS [Iris pallida]